MRPKFERSNSGNFLCLSLSLLAAGSFALSASAQPAKQPKASPPPGAQQPATKRAYLSQAYIDSLVNRGFYELTEGVSLADIGKRQEEAVARAKQLGAQLLQLAKGDPNEKYIQWRVGELYAQIALEEQEIFERKEKERLIVVNYLVQTFNNEVGKRRPDFKQLHTLLEQLESVDPRKANEMEASINSRSQGVSREIVASIERLLAKGDLDHARRELDYCDANLNFLVVSVAAYAQLSAKLRSRMDIMRERGLIAVQLKLAEDMLARDSLQAAFKAAADARSRLTAIRQEITPQEFDRNTAKCLRVLAAIEERENQLVEKSYEILSKKGIDAAIAFLDNDMKGYCPSRTKTVMVNNSIISALLEDRRRKAEGDTAISPEIASLVNGSEDPDLTVEALKTAAKQRAQARADSVRIANLSPRERRALRRKQKEMQALQQRRERNRPAVVATAASMSAPRPDAGGGAAPTVAQPPAPDPAAQRRAKERLISIYLLLEQNNVAAAQATYLQYQEDLRAHLVPEAFETLRLALDQASASSSRR